MLSRFRSTILAALVPLLACAGGASDGATSQAALATVDVTVTPANLLMAAGASTTFTASVTGSADTGVTWAVQEGGAGGTIDASGAYVAPAAAGVYHVVATSHADPSRSATAVVTVEASATPPATDITIAPTAVVVPTGSQQTFTCSGSSTGCTYSVAEGSVGGSIDSNGLYTAPLSAGTYHVVATNKGGTKKATAVVVVTAPAAQTVAVAISPTSIALQTGAAQAFQCTVTGSTDTACGWSIQEGSAGGSIDAAGNYTAPGSPGTYHVVASSHADPTKSAAATVTVTAPPPPVTVSVSPTSIAILTGGTQSFACTVGGATDTACIWSVQEGSAGGTVDSNGHYTAPSVAGTYHVVATSHADTTRSAVATVTVTAPPPPPPAIAVTISPATVSLLTGGAQGFSCTVTGTTDTACTWSIQEGSAGGSIDANGRYTAPGTAGTYHVVATSHADGTTRSTATVVVSAPPPPITIAVSPASVAVLTSAAYSFSCTVTGTTDTACTWSIQEGSAGGSVDANGRYTAPATAGTYHVVATSHADATKRATATVSVSAPVVPVSVVVTPASASVSGCQSVTLAATVSGTTNQAVTWSIQEGASGGTISAQGVYTAPSTAGTYHAIATSSADATKSASATILVADKVLSVAVTPSTVTVQTGQTVQFTATVTTTCGAFQSSAVAGS